MASDRTWRGSVEISPYWAGQAFKVTRLQVRNVHGRTLLVVDDGPTFTVTGKQAWELRPIRTPVRVVTGDEHWRPQARVVDRMNGSPIPGAWIDTQSRFSPLSPRRSVAPPMRADDTGTWTSPVTLPVTEAAGTDDPLYLVYGRRGTRGWSLEDAGCLSVTIKLQANSRYSSQSLNLGETLTVTGNAWPAPAIHSLGNGNVHLQRLEGDRWTILTTATVRHNGRYTLNWAPDARGTHQLRVRRPGATYAGLDRDCAASVGTNLISVPVGVD